MGPVTAARLFFEGVPSSEVSSRAPAMPLSSSRSQRFVVFHDASSLPANPGWAVRNVLYYLQSHHDVLSVELVCLRQGSESRIGHVSTEYPAKTASQRPQVVGWERDGAGRLASRIANLGPMLDPSR